MMISRFRCSNVCARVIYPFTAPAVNPLTMMLGKAVEYCYGLRQTIRQAYSTSMGNGLRCWAKRSGTTDNG